jgi:hypothetical protein
MALSGGMRRLEPHPLIAHLEPSGTPRPASAAVLRVERRDLKGSSIWAGPYLAFVVQPEPDLAFRIPYHADVAWAVGCAVHQWFMRHGVPTDATHATRALFALEDVECDQELKCWFRVDMANGAARGAAIVEGLDATSPGLYPSVNDYLMTTPQYRKPPTLALRLRSLLIPENRCPDSARELTLRADRGQEIRYRTGVGGAPEVTGRTGAEGGGPTPEEILEIARRQRQDEATGE